MGNDNMAAAIDWLDAYRGRSLDILDMYDASATLECRCTGATLIGAAALAKYWTERFKQAPVHELIDLEPRTGDAVAVTYLISSAIVTALLEFDSATGKICGQWCGIEAQAAAA